MDIERHLPPSKPSLQTCDYGEKPLRIVVPVREREVPPTAVVAFVRDVDDEADPRGPERLCFSCTPEIEHAGDDFAERRARQVLGS
jgi:hypothetical protein